MNKLVICFSVIVILTGACRSTKKAASSASSPAEAQQVAAANSNIEKGKHMFEENCSNCHALKHPSSKNADEWKEIVPVMVNKVNEKAGVVVINSDDKARLLEYLLHASKL